MNDTTFNLVICSISSVLIFAGYFSALVHKSKVFRELFIVSLGVFTWAILRDDPGITLLGKVSLFAVIGGTFGLVAYVLTHKVKAQVNTGDSANNASEGIAPSGRDSLN